MDYQEQMKHPLWQKKRLEVMELHCFKCQTCGSDEDTLNVHHPFYRRGAMIWEYNKEELECLCRRCHKDANAIDESIRRALAICLNKQSVLEFINKLNSTAPSIRTVEPRVAAKKIYLPAVFRKPMTLNDGTYLDSAEKLEELWRIFRNG